MLFDSLKKIKYQYSGDYYGYQVKTEIDTSTINQYYEVPISFRCALSTSFIGDLVILSDTKLQIKGRIKNVVDRNGNEIYINGDWEISSTQPVLNAMGLVDGYKYKAKIISGDI
jgi:hypothetical protein